MHRFALGILAIVLSLIAAACSDDAATDETTASTASPVTTATTPTTAAPATTAAPGTTAAQSTMDAPVAPFSSLDAPLAAIQVDGDASDWDGIAGLDMTLVEITGETVDPQDATVKVAHDGEYLYMLFAVPDDYDFVLEDHKLSPAIGVMWAIDAGAGPAMGATEDDQETSLGLVDIWHWELDCVAGAEQGGSVSGPGDGTGGNDAACNMDDEYSTDPETREDDDTASAENSLLGVFEHTNPVDGEDGTWYFEMSRPLQTGDAQDAQFTVGGTGMLAMAYWDPDVSVEGWDDATHVVSAVEGWIGVTLLRN